MSSQLDECATPTNELAEPTTPTECDLSTPTLEVETHTIQPPDLQETYTGRKDAVSPVTPPPVPPTRSKKRKEKTESASIDEWLTSDANDIIETDIEPEKVDKGARVAELKCSEVRWFYKRKDGDKWIPFNGRDSLMLEIKYRLSHDITLDEQASGYADEADIVNRDMVVVLDGLFRLTKCEGLIEAIYWKDDSCEVRRGSWFTSDWQPIEPQHADSIDRHHLQYFRGQLIPEGLTVFSQKEASNKPQLTELHLDNMEVRWSSVIDIQFSIKRGALLRYIGWGKTQSLRRGYEESLWSDSPAEISHLILVVHGIGQKGYENLIAQNAQQVRDGVVAAIERCFPEEKKRPMFLPVEWRSSLVLDNGVTDQLTLPKMSSMRSALNSTAMDIMYYQSPLYRREIVGGVTAQLNKVHTMFKENNPTFNGPVSIFAHSLGSVIAYDILTHYSPLMLYDTCVTQAINDHLETCTDETSASTMKAFRSARDELHTTLEGGMKQVLLRKEEQLQFKAKYLFAIGSPLGVFLVMRGATCADLEPARMNVERIFNLFHPYDPVAYRLEPLFAEEWKHIRPIKLFACNDLRGRNSYDDLSLDVYKTYIKKLKNMAKGKKNGDKLGDARSGGDEELDEEDECDSDDLDAKSGCSSPRSLSPTPGDRAAQLEKPVKKSWFSFSSSAPKKPINASVSNEPPVEMAKEAEMELSLADKILVNAKKPDFRMDFQLQPAITDKSYWSVLKSHFSYWTNQDLAVFVANVLHRPTSKP